MSVFLVLLVSYLLGSVSFGYLAGRIFKGVDIREYGSGNAGSTNVIRTLGIGPGILVFILDVSKGYLAIYLARLVAVDMPTVIMLAGVAVVIGHNWPVFFRFRGGRGVATSIGVLLGLAPSVILIAFAVGLFIIAVTRYVSLGSVIGSILVPLLMIVFNKPLAFILFSIVLATFSVWRHRQNIRRLLDGTENKLGEKVEI